ncbi:MAG: 4-hydroxy-3-methylbut-2-enyl diphosphate reductase [Puniceicoccales bacterium]|jgi:4-hydroxy-3-methylbut-2-enyl diphosphate reductase|nr:4-hydroxy-3-methylbut-2-enyl diphosphate reductase [Puniceicoccales bacterium]
MRVIVPKIFGFCGGVRRAINLVCTACELSRGRVYTDGELVHNGEVLGKLKSLGVEPFDDAFPPPFASDDCVVIRAHGCTKNRRIHLGQIFGNVIDGTCPHVIGISKAVERAANDGKTTVIIGDRKHPEVISIASYAESSHIYTVNSFGEIGSLPKNLHNILVVAQSTIDSLHFGHLAEKMAELYPGCEIKNTICSASYNRQKMIFDLKKSGAKAVVIIGGKNSNNTLTLVKISKSLGFPTFHVENAADLPIAQLGMFSPIGVAAGASTDQKTLVEVISALENL